MPQSEASLDDWLAYLESLHASEMELGLDRVMVVYRRLMPEGLPGRVVIIGGTNGKGSTLAALESLLLSGGHSTGAYTSPHIRRFNERIRIDGVEATDAAICRAMAAVEQARRNVPLTYFEFTTLAAFWLFREAGVAYPLLEVGLGGRLDAVNVAEPVLSIITGVDLDHTQWLGNDREQIGYEKAGILRAARPALFGDPDPPASVTDQAAAQAIPLRVRGRDFGGEDGHDGFSAPQQTALAAFGMLGFETGQDALATLKEAPLPPGRFQRLDGTPPVILDVGHNPQAARWLAKRLRDIPERPVEAVYGAMGDKDLEGVAGALADVIDGWHLAALPGSRGLTAQQVNDRISGTIPDDRIRTTRSVSEALASAREAAGTDGCIVVFGSFLTVSEALALLGS
ncbi:bifunctional folylpolyglutamate synthase/dihydrofolate synthase [Vreelandella utahensis]|uniref:bifunctional folylpolyglutamate synthase/dihydrofolate synthase n=1 Tax=Vreelandella halophila TaxID=86177 RepID=UPI000985967F|nr:folylpolyglutamate synthase/dihydrofolate synthase family protein [Halomonas utahensis]